jgi:hypothetical protein
MTDKKTRERNIDQLALEISELPKGWKRLSSKKDPMQWGHLARMGYKLALHDVLAILQTNKGVSPTPNE